MLQPNCLWHAPVQALCEEHVACGLCKAMAGVRGMIVETQLSLEVFMLFGAQNS